MKIDTTIQITVKFNSGVKYGFPIPHSSVAMLFVIFLRTQFTVKNHCFFKYLSDLILTYQTKNLLADGPKNCK